MHFFFSCPRASIYPDFSVLIRNKWFIPINNFNIRSQVFLPQLDMGRLADTAGRHKNISCLSISVRQRYRRAMTQHYIFRWHPFSQLSKGCQKFQIMVRIIPFLFFVFCLRTASLCILFRPFIFNILHRYLQFRLRRSICGVCLIPPTTFCQIRRCVLKRYNMSRYFIYCFAQTLSPDT